MKIRDNWIESELSYALLALRLAKCGLFSKYSKYIILI